MPGQMKRFANFFSRSAVRARQNLGIVLSSERTGIKKVRKTELEIFDGYYESTQYEKLPQWDDAHSKDGEYVPVRKRQPRIVYAFPKVLVDRVSAKLVGGDVFPTLKIEDDPDTSMFIQLIIKASKLKSRLHDTVKLMLRSGSALLRFYLIDGSIMLESYHSKHCYPEFKPNGKLKSVRIQYTYDDENDKDGTGKPKEKWYRLDLTETVDTLFSNPEYSPDAEPVFQVVSETPHSFGFVQAEWFRTTEEKHSPDGTSLFADILDFIDEINYNLSQSSQAVAYSQEPQLTISGMDGEQLDNLIRSSAKAWALGQNGKAEFVEARMEGVKSAGELRDKVRLGIQDVARVLLMDPEKVVAHAQSGKAMEVLHGPLLELVNEIRPEIEDRLIELVSKLAAMILLLDQQGFQTDIIIPPGFVPKSMNITAMWPAIFPPTYADLLAKTQATTAATAARLISEESGTRYIAKDFGVENVDEELQKLEAQPILSPFGGGGGFDGAGNPGQP